MQAIVTVTRRVTYSSIVEMSEAEFTRFNAALQGSRAERAKAEEELNRKVDVRDWQDDSLDQLDEFKRFEEGD